MILSIFQSQVSPEKDWDQLRKQNFNNVLIILTTLSRASTPSERAFVNEVLLRLSISLKQSFDFTIVCYIVSFNSATERFLSGFYLPVFDESCPYVEARFPLDFFVVFSNSLLKSSLKHFCTTKHRLRGLWWLWGMAMPR